MTMLVDEFAAIVRGTRAPDVPEHAARTVPCGRTLSHAASPAFAVVVYPLHGAPTAADLRVPR